MHKPTFSQGYHVFFKQKLREYEAEEVLIRQHFEIRKNDGEFLCN